MNRSKRTRRRFVLASMLGLATVVASGVAAPSVGAATKTTKSVKAAAPTTFPKLKVLDLATSKTIDLASLNRSAKPQLIWFWAPT